MRWRDKPPAGTPIDTRYHLSTGLLRAWTMNEGQGSALWDAAGGTTAGISGTGYSWASTPHGHGLALAGGNAVVTDSGAWLAGLKSASLVFVANATGTGGGSYGRLMDASGAAITLLVNTSFTSVQGVVNGITGTFPTPDIRAWHVYIFTWQSGVSWTLYVDGTPISAASPPTATLSAPTYVYLGNNSTGTRGFAGQIAYSAAYGRCLADAEVRSLTAALWSVYRPALGWPAPEFAAYYAGAARVRRTLYTRAGSRGVA
ncbi:hypothetical protein OJF2_72560 [Aquisphaera giovannonii]|uniref:LamG-like jellyroll fold domain-containing protein n=1 Tax=Aquisphaera giovannonii TaxID=406548 RepID=A0A5B9WFI6_9BACT|nr:LamG domain-containing protein [Aquisphaera giovannonii]QEH38650.1 hypothetical protein OJF2_72560 [Aquisphaera giovannonii]